MNADRVAAHPDTALAHLQYVSFEDAVQMASGVIDKGLGIALGLKADQVVLAKCQHQLAVPRDGPQHRRAGEGNVQEETDAVVQALFAAGLSQRDEMVIVHPKAVRGLGQRRQQGSKPLVDFDIALVVFPVVLAKVNTVMKCGPQDAIGKPPIVAVVIALGQRYGAEVDVIYGLGDGRRGRLARYMAAPAQPDAARLAQRIKHADYQAARRALAFSDGRHTIRYNDQPAHSWSLFPVAGPACCVMPTVGWPARRVGLRGWADASALVSGRRRS